MEHAIKKELANGYIHIVAEAGYALFSLALQRVVSEAVIKAESESRFVTIQL